MRGLLSYLRLRKLILQPQYAENPYNICGLLTWLQVPYLAYCKNAKVVV